MLHTHVGQFIIKSLHESLTFLQSCSCQQQLAALTKVSAAQVKAWSFQLDLLPWLGNVFLSPVLSEYILWTVTLINSLVPVLQCSCAAWAHQKDFLSPFLWDSKKWLQSSLDIFLHSNSYLKQQVFPPVDKFFFKAKAVSFTFWWFYLLTVNCVGLRETCKHQTDQVKVLILYTCILAHLNAVVYYILNVACPLMT